jgi:ubiquinone/menaquinone biosynthesis C-methylase UbiE
MSADSELQSHSDWTSAYQELFASGAALSFPNETLLRLFKGNYVPNMPRSLKGLRALDVGFGSGNNLHLLTSMGMEVAGTEVSEEICLMTGQRMRVRGIRADLRVGTNTALPYNDDTFDFLVSWNVLHYEDTDDKIRKGISEYARVLKPGGRVFISTTAPDHKILKDSMSLGGHLHQIGRSDDFRKGAVYFYFKNESDIRSYFEPVFDEVMVGRTHDRLFTETLDWFLVTGTAP